jgi:hypothetical protein
MPFDGGDVDPVANHKQAAGARGQLVETRDHLDQLGVVNLPGCAVQRNGVDLGGRSVGGLDNGQRRGVGLHKEQRGAAVTHCPADRLSQSGRGHKCGDQHDVLNLVGRQRVAKGCRFERIGARHPDGGQLEARTTRIVAGTHDGGDHSIRRADGGRFIGGDDELVLVNRCAVSVFTL